MIAVVAAPNLAIVDQVTAVAMGVMHPHWVVCKYDADFSEVVIK